MMYPQIRCFHAAAPVNPNEFYILSKGPNAGKPAFTPWVNSFTVICPHQAYFDFYFWLIYGLFQAGKFKMRQRGSAIPFINLDDVRDLIREAAPVIHPYWHEYRQIVENLNKLEKRKATLAEQIIATENLQRSLIRMCFEKRK